MFVISKNKLGLWERKPYPWGYGFKNRWKIYSLADGFLSFVISISGGNWWSVDWWSHLPVSSALQQCQEIPSHHLLLAKQAQQQAKVSFKAVKLGNSFFIGYRIKSAVRVRCGSDCGASACCTAGPSSNLGSASLEEAIYRADAMRITRVVLYE